MIIVLPSHLNTQPYRIAKTSCAIRSPRWRRKLRVYRLRSTRPKSLTALSRNLLRATKTVPRAHIRHRGPIPARAQSSTRAAPARLRCSTTARRTTSVLPLRRNRPCATRSTRLGARPQRHSRRPSRPSRGTPCRNSGIISARRRHLRALSPLRLLWATMAGGRKYRTRNRWRMDKGFFLGYISS